MAGAQLSVTAGWAADSVITVDKKKLAEVIGNVKESIPSPVPQVSIYSYQAPVPGGEEYSRPAGYGRSYSLSELVQRIDFSFLLLGDLHNVPSHCFDLASECLSRQKSVTVISVNELPDDAHFRLVELDKEEAGLIKFLISGTSAKMYEEIRRLLTRYCFHVERAAKGGISEIRDSDLRGSDEAGVYL